MSKIYKKNKDIFVVKKGIYENYRYFILSIYGSHPAAYIEVGPDNFYFNKELIGDFEDVVHGGITYCEHYLDKIYPKDEKRWIIGWDYAHSGDFVRLDLPFWITPGSSDWGGTNGKKWSEDEILRDIFSFIEKIKQKNKKN